MKPLIAGFGLLLSINLAWAQQSTGPSQKAVTPEACQAQIEALKPAKLAWRQIAWKSCLLEGLQEAKAKDKPVLLWVFIDRPTDDARC
jgi:hypothetical protein